MSDYDRIAQAITFITHRVNSQPTLDEIAAHIHLSPFHFQRLFCRWAGVTPKRFLQTLTLERAKQLLSESKPLLEIADTLGRRGVAVLRFDVRGAAIQPPRRVGKRIRLDIEG